MVEAVVSVLRLTLVRLAYCVCRQAERSIDYAMRFDDGLSQLRSYYTSERIDFLIQVRRSLGFGNPGGRVTNAHSFSLLFALVRLLLLPIGAVLGVRWYSQADVIWVTSSLDEFHRLLVADDSQEMDEFVRLRMRLYACQRILERGCILTGDLPSLGRRVEHLGQSDFLEFASISALLKKRE